MSFGRSQGQNAGSDLTKPDVFASADSVVTIRSSSASEQDVTDQSRAIQTGISPPKDKRTDETGLRSDTLREGAIRVSPLTSTPLDQTLAMKYSSPGPNDSVDPVNESGDHLLGQPFERFDQVEVLTSMGEDENESLQFEKGSRRQCFTLVAWAFTLFLNSCRFLIHQTEI
jgi:hypothetical protein